MFAILLMGLMQWGYALEGQFYFQGEQVLRQALRVEVIPTQSPMSFDQMDNLKSQGYKCERRSSFYRCQKFLDISQQLEVPVIEPKQDNLEFGPVVGKEVLVDGEDLLQYQVEQKIKIGDEIFTTALYTYLKSVDLLKLAVPNAQAEHHFIVHGNQELSQFYFPRKKESRWVWRSFIKEVFFSKNPL